jgi:hypothetical protein
MLFSHQGNIANILNIIQRKKEGYCSGDNLMAIALYFLEGSFLLKKNMTTGSSKITGYGIHVL